MPLSKRVAGAMHPSSMFHRPCFGIPLCLVPTRSHARQGARRRGCYRPIGGFAVSAWCANDEVFGHSQRCGVQGGDNLAATNHVPGTASKPFLRRALGSSPAAPGIKLPRIATPCQQSAVMDLDAQLKFIAGTPVGPALQLLPNPLYGECPWRFISSGTWKRFRSEPTTTPTNVDSSACLPLPPQP